MWADINSSRHYDHMTFKMIIDMIIIYASMKSVSGWCAVVAQQNDMRGDVIHSTLKSIVKKKSRLKIKRERSRKPREQVKIPQNLCFQHRSHEFEPDSY